MVVLGLIVALAPTQSGDPADESAQVDLERLYDPIDAGEPIPSGYVKLLERDDILPIYRPELVAATDVDWGEDDLVIGVAIGGEARAYPVSLLNFREMVLDQIGETPLLVSW